MARINTFNNFKMSPADICRENGWQAGDILEGDGGQGLCRIRLTAIGEAAVLAKCLLHENYERQWALYQGEWRKLNSPNFKFKSI
jgi:hypothetical protein